MMLPNRSFWRWKWAVIAGILVTHGSAPLAQAADADRLTLLDGRSTTATISAIDAQGGIKGSGVEGSLDLQGVRQIVRSIKPDAQSKTAAEVHLATGGILLAESVELTTESVIAKWKYADKLTIPSEIVRAVRFASATAAGGRPADSAQGREAFAKALAQPLRDKDHLLAIAEGKVQQLTGLMQEWGAGAVSFDWEGQVRSITRDRVYGLVLAQLGEPIDLAGLCVVELRDHSSLGGKLESLADGKVSLRLSPKLTVSLPWTDVTRVTVRSDRLVFASDLKPTEVREKPIVTLPRPWQADKNVLGGPLKITGQAFDKGIGVHARSELAFIPGGKFDTFAAVVGIDDAAGGRGDCEFIVLADGKELARQRMRGGEPPREIRATTGNARVVTLIVEPGADLDLADHADWCDARFLRSAAR